MTGYLMDIPWIVLVVLLPMVGAIGCFIYPSQSKYLGLITSLTIVASIGGLGWQLLETGVRRYAIGGWRAPLGIDLYADGLSLVMVAITGLVGFGISVYANSYFEHSKSRHFWPLWLFLIAALNALFLSADLFNLYITLELLGLAAVALVALARSADAYDGAMRYLLVSLLGSLVYLFGLALLYHAFGTVDIALLSQQVTPAPAVWAAMGLMVAGLALKTALIPMHFWLPPAHASAPSPVSAILSALIVKASFYVLLRLWLEVFPSTRGMTGELLAGLGALAVLWGGMQALRQTRLKMLIAYSTVAQLGYLFLAFSIDSATVWRAALVLLVSHALAKAAMFMAAGNVIYSVGHDRITDLDRVAQRLPLTIIAFGLAGVSIIGLPPSGGFISKWLFLEAAIRNGQWAHAGVIVLGGLMAAGYTFKVIGNAFTQERAPREQTDIPAAMEWSALLLALAAILLAFVANGMLGLLEIGAPFGGASAA